MPYIYDQSVDRFFFFVTTRKKLPFYLCSTPAATIEYQPVTMPCDSRAYCSFLSLQYLGRIFFVLHCTPPPGSRLPGFQDVADHVVTYQLGVIAGDRGSDLSNRHELRRSRLAPAAQALDSGRPSLLRAPLLLPISLAMMPVCCEGMAVASKVAGSSLIRLLSKHR